MSAEDEDDWSPLRTRPKPHLEPLLAQDPDREFDVEDQIKFFEQLAEDYGPMEIGLSMGWSPAAVNRFISEPSRAELIDMIVEAQHESVERGILRCARTGNSTAMKLYAYNKMQHRGWADRSKLEITGKSQHEIVLSVSEAIETQMTAAVTARGSEAIAEIQAAYLEPDIPKHDADTEIVDAEIVE